MLSGAASTLLLTSFLAWSLPLGSAAGAQAEPGSSDEAAIREAASWVGQSDRIETEFRYVMTCRVRLLLFWAGRDDVGGGYIRIAERADDEPQQLIQVLFGSDPAKAPLSINRWGAATEVLRNAESSEAASALFGFMKSSKGQSPLAMRSELSKENAEGNHLFEGIISRVDGHRAISTTVPFVSARDFDLHHYAEAEHATLKQLDTNPARHIRRLDTEARQACPNPKQFLSTILQLSSDAVAGHPTPVSLCYVYNARHYTATLLSIRPVPEKKVHVTLQGTGGSVDRTYRNLCEAHFQVTGQETRTKSVFEILLGTEGSLRGTPVQITYEPNWWFQIFLNLTSVAQQPKNSGAFTTASDPE